MTTLNPPHPPRRLPLYALYAANVISVSGNVMAYIAIPWFVLQTTHSASQTGLTAAVTALPAVLATFFGGVIVDRMGYKRTSIVADVASGLAIGLIPFLYAAVGLAFWQLLVLVFVGNLLDAPGATAREAITPDLADLAGMSMERAIAFQDAAGRMARFIGAPVAGVLIALVGTASVLWIDAATFILSALIVALAVPRPAARPAAPAATSYRRDLAEGLSFIRRDRLILTIVWVVMITNFLDAASSAVVIPVYVNRVFGSAEVLGWLFGVFGATAFVCALLVGLKGIPWSRRLTLGIAFIFVSFRFWVLALYSGLPLLLVLFAANGVAAGFLNPILSAVQVERIPPAMRARVFGVVTAGVMLGTPLAGLGGVMVDQLGMTLTLVILGACYLATTSSLLIIPAMRQMDHAPATA
jgi:MFS family permease